MPSGGYFIIYREIFSHPIFAPEPFTEREAWVWMICTAAWQPCAIRVGSSVVNIKRGELVHSTRFLARKWRWSESRVRRFLKRLQGDAMIDAILTRQTTHLTICNYDKYQNMRRSDRRNFDAASDANKKETKEPNKKGTTSPKKAPALAKRLPDDWCPSPETVEWAYSEFGFTRDALYQLLLQFRDYWIGEGGQKSRKIDWNRTFKNRCRDVGAQGRRPNGSQKPGWGEAAKDMMKNERANIDASELPLGRVRLPTAKRP